jgi:hypothetical protein
MLHHLVESTKNAHVLVLTQVRECAAQERRGRCPTVAVAEPAATRLARVCQNARFSSLRSNRGGRRSRDHPRAARPQAMARTGHGRRSRTAAGRQDTAQRSCGGSRCTNAGCPLPRALVLRRCHRPPIAPSRLRWVRAADRPAQSARRGCRRPAAPRSGCQCGPGG